MVNIIFWPDSSYVNQNCSAVIVFLVKKQIKAIHVQIQDSVYCHTEHSVALHNEILCTFKQPKTDSSTPCTESLPMSIKDDQNLTTAFFWSCKNLNMVQIETRQSQQNLSRCKHLQNPSNQLFCMFYLYLHDKILK